MEDINLCLSLCLNESVNHDFAIRRFCPARMDQDQGGGECQDQESLLDEMIELCSSDAATCLASSEVDEFVDSFINMDQYQYDNENLVSLDKHQNFDHFLMNDEGVIDAIEEANIGIEKGLDLVHMLLACAEAVSCRDTQQAELLLGKIWALASPLGDSLQRVSHFFAAGLKCRLSLLSLNVFANGTLTTSAIAMDVPLISREDKLEAFQLLYQATPYMAFGFMAANEAIYQASLGKSYIHIIDIGLEHTLQWPSLIRLLSSRPEGPWKLRITGLIANEDKPKLQISINVLVEEARSLGISLEFHIISELATPYLLTKEKLNLREGEAVFVNSILQLHKYVKESRSYLKTILESLKKLGPIALIVVEQDTNHNGPFFLGRFLESLHYYSAIFDSIEASMPRNSQHRMKIEKLHFAQEILNIIAYEGPDRMERHERVDQWRRKLGRAGFQGMPLKCISQVRKMLSVYDCDGYTLSCDKGTLLLGWKGRPIMMASAWQVPSV